MCVSLPRQFLRRFFLSLMASLGLLASLAGRAQAQQILEIYADSLTTYKPSGNTAVQGVRPLHLQRGVGVDGSLRARPGLAIGLQGNPFEDVWLGHDRQGDLNLATGAWSPFEVDIALPAKGFSWVIGRTYNARQETSGGSATDSNGYQGYNWFQASQPEIVLHDDADNTKDVLNLVYGAGAYVEYLRTGSSSNDYKGKDGAAGIFVYAAGAGAEPDTFTLTDQHGNTVAFFGFDGDSGTSAGQLWKMTDPDSNTAFVGHATTGSSAISSGYSSGKITTAYDTSDRRFSYTYTSVDSVSRLTRVKAETKTGGTWASPSGVSTVAQVDYTYYATADSDIANGSSGDLKKVTITEYLDDSVTLTKKRYFRYWKGTYNSSTNPGYPHALWYTFDFEGVRSFDWAGDSSFDEDFLSATESSLKPYAAAYFEYDSAHKVREAWFNGQCGCSGGSNGTFEYTYETNGSFSGTSGYDTTWERRTLIKRPDGSYLTQYFDETGQALSQVITDIIPSSSSPTPKKWVTAVTRDSSGQVSEISTPANVTGYTHSTGAITTSTSAGLVRAFVRETSGNMTGFVFDEKHKKGTSGSAYLDHTYTWTSLSKSAGAGAVYRPLVASERVYSTEITSGTSGSYLTSYSYTSYSGTLAPETVTKTHPTVSTGNNGSGSATEYKTHYRQDGLVDYEKDEDGIITYRGYTDGKETTLIQDADTGSLSEPTGFTSSGTALNLTTTTTYSAQGFQQVQTPPHNVDKILRTRLADHRLVVLKYSDFVSGSGTFYGPVSYTVFNQAGEAEVRATVGLSGNLTTTATSGHIDETDADPITAADLGTVKQMTTLIYSEAGNRLDEERRYFLIPASGAGTDGTNYDPTKYSYNDSGARWRTKEASGTIRRTVVDAIGRVSEHWIGTNDNSFSGGEASGTDNMVKTDFVEYDGDSDGGNGLVTERTLRVQSSSTDEGVTVYTFDLRGRLLLQANPTAPHAFYKYDNLGRRIATGLFSSTASITALTDDPTTETSNRLALTQTFFDEKGQVWKTQQHKIDAADGSDDDNLQAVKWYDASGRVVKVDGEELKKTKYDRIGRVIDEYVLAVDNDTAYGDADDVTGDVVLEERQARYHATDGTVTQRCRIDRFHSDISTGETTGPLDTNADTNATTLTSTNIKGRIQIAAYYYDNIERELDRVDYGTYAAATWTRPSNADARSDTALRTSTAYNTDGTIETVTDPKALVTKWEYDAQGRKTKEVRNYDVGVNSGNPSGTDDNVTTVWAYTDGLMTSLTADVPSGETDQVTAYVYGSTAGTPSQMKIATGHLLRAVKYPDSANSGTTVANIDSDSSDVVSFAYNAQGQEVYKKDQAGSVIQSDFDTSGRNTQKRVTTVASGFDNAILRIATTYDGLGRRSEVVQYDNATVGSGTAKDGVKYTYDGWGLIEKFEMDRNSAVAGGGDDYEVSYTWTKATSGRDTVRKTDMTQPGGRVISYNYRSAGGLHDDEASRVTLVKDGATTLCQYDYNGVGQVVRTKYNEASVMWQQYSTTAGDYPDLDRFNRVVRSRWTKDLTSPLSDVDFYRVDLEYDRNSNITWAEDQVHSGFDVKYTIDDVNRLTRAEEGTRSGSSITTRARDQQWTLTQTGNWELDKVDLNGDGDFVDGGELNDDRTHNAVNELAARDTDDNGTDNYTLTYDAVGNLTDDAEDAKYEYDVFGRLRKIKRTTTSALVAEHRYNGLGYRIGIHEDTDTDGDVDANDKWYYDAFDETWRHIARYRESDTSPKEDFVPHQAGKSGTGEASYIDLVVCRNKDANTSWTAASDGSLEERHYYCQNWRADVSALVNGSGTLLKEWVKYSAYGVPFGVPGGDTNSDGDCDSADVTQVYNWRTANPVQYDVRGDIDLNGVLDATDESTIQTSFSGITLAREKLSANSITNRRGFAGGELVVSALYQFRCRFLSPGLGRWLVRDPCGHVDGLSLYEYVSSDPITAVDPTGLSRAGGGAPGASGGAPGATGDAKAAHPLIGCWKVTQGQAGGSATVTISDVPGPPLAYSSSSGDMGLITPVMGGYAYASTNGGGAGVIQANGDGTYAWQATSGNAGGKMTKIACPR